MPGKYGENVGELVITLDGDKLTVASYRLYPIDDTIAGDRAIENEIDKFKKRVTEVAFASRGYSIDQPLAVAPRDIPNTYTDIAAGTILANFCTDAFRNATKAELGFTANGMMRAGLTRGKSGVQTVYDVFSVAPLGAGVVDTTAGSTLVTGYFTGQELKHLLEFFLLDSPAHPGEYFPRASGLRFRYDPSRPKFNVVTAIEMGDLDRGYRTIDISGKDERLFSLTTPLMVAMILVATATRETGHITRFHNNKPGPGRPLKMTELYPYEAAPEAPSLLEADLFECMIDRPANLPDYYLPGPGVWIAGADMLLAAGHVPGGARPRGWTQFCRGAYTKPSRDGQHTLQVRQHDKFWIIERSGEVDVDGVSYRGIEALVFNFQVCLAPFPIWTRTQPAAMWLAEYCDPVPPARVQAVWAEAGLFDLGTGWLVTLPATKTPSTVSR